MFVPQLGKDWAYNMSMLRRGLLLMFLLTASLLFAETIKHLILKDGSYQAVTKYEVHGGRVRYYSAERNVWEEVPNELVDWPATKQYEANIQAKADEEAARQKAREAAIDAEDRIDPKDARTPEVAPNLRLPEAGGVYALDTYNGQPQVVELTQNSSETNQHTGSYILLKSVDPVAGKRETIEIPGAHAKVQLHTGHPVIYLNLDTDPDSDTADKRVVFQQRASSDAYLFRFVKLDSKRTTRLLATIIIDVADEASVDEKVLTTVGQLTPGNMWVKIEPKEDLAPGEYAIVQMLSSDKLNSFVWDFGVNPTAPANAGLTQAGAQKPQANDADTTKKMKD